MIRHPWKTNALRLMAATGATLITLAVGGDTWAATGEKHEAWNWSGPIAAGRTLEINGVNGSITAEASSGSTIEIVADKHGKKQDPALVKLKVVQDSDGVTVCAIYPGTSGPCESPGERHVNIHNNDVQVDFRIKVPAGITFEANNVNGGITARALTGTVRARTVNGSCDIQTSRGAEAATVNGSVHAVLGHVGANDELSFNTVNGSITLMLPEHFGAVLDGATVNGSIQADFPITVSGKWGPKSVHASFGDGAARLSANTVNGSIHLKRSQ